jgi:cytochrome P450
MLHDPAIARLDDNLRGQSNPPVLGASLLDLRLQKSDDLAQHRPHFGELSTHENRDILAMLLGAGSDSTSAVLQIFFKVAALHPAETSIAQDGK